MSQSIWTMCEMIGRTILGPIANEIGVKTEGELHDHFGRKKTFNMMFYYFCPQFRF